jgi:PucR-like helix-turn-helix protein
MNEERHEMAGLADEGPRTPIPRTADTAWAGELLGQLRPGGRDLRRVVAWLAREVDGTVCVWDDTKDVLAGDPVPLPDVLFADVLTGRISSAAVQDRGRYLRLVAMRYCGPLRASAGVLAVARETPFDRREAEIVTRTAPVVELLLREGELAMAAERLRRATADLRLAILQLLMVEDIIAARRVAAGLWPGLLDTDTAGVYVVEGTAEERDRLVDECTEATGGRTLVARCPAMDRHVIVVTPTTEAGQQLRSLVGERPGTYLGGSVRQSLVRTSLAYGQAISALAVAHFRPDRTAVYAERTHPETLMDVTALRAWSADVLRPLDALPHHIRAELLATTRLGLEYTAVSTAKVLGVSRNTVRARMDRVETLLRTDFSDLTVRATVHLALNTQAGCAAPGIHQRATEPPAVRLDGLLAGPALRTWAHDLLGRLTLDGRDLRGTLRAWIAAGGNAERAAQDLGVHAQTVREHVRSAEPVLERQLLASGSDLYEVVLALLVVGDLAEPVLRRTEHAWKRG